MARQSQQFVDQYQKLIVYKNLPISDPEFLSLQNSLPDFKSSYKFPRDNSLIGIEIEVENVKTPKGGILWYFKNDNSLRNHGIEYISVPLPPNQIEIALYYLYNYILPKNVDFSPRTSIHIHLNIRDMTPDQLKSLVITYMAVEKLLFEFDNTGRYKSIFCVPLEECSLLDILSEFSKILSFAFRLFGNIFAGEVLLTIVAFLVPVLASFPFIALEIFVGFVQALVFSMLTAVFLSGAIAEHH